MDKTVFQERFRIAKVSRPKLITGFCLVALGVGMPHFLNVQNFRIYQTLLQAIRKQEAVLVLLAALKLVALNSVRCFPHYLGAFFVADSIELNFVGKRPQLFRAAVVCSVIPPVYFLIERIYHIRYDFGAPAVVLIVLLIALEKADFSLVNLSKKSLMVMMMVTAFQCLDLAPVLSGMPFGRGETSSDVKRVATFLGAEGYLQTTMILIFAALMFAAFLLGKLIMDENNLRLLSELQAQNERMKTEERMRVLENRTYLELQHLVHDLKTPLTSVQALVGVCKMGSERDGREHDTEYLLKIEKSVEYMNTMISEILHESHCTPMVTSRVVSAVLAQVSVSEYAPMVSTQNRVPDAVIVVNRIRFSRALINLIENSFYAVDRTSGKIFLEVDAVVQNNKPYVRFVVTDNGKGIAQDALASIWGRGFSTRNSNGLGLSFVQSVVEKNSGIITMDSKVGQGTRATILLPVGEAHAE